LKEISKEEKKYKEKVPTSLLYLLFPEHSLLTQGAIRVCRVANGISYETAS